MKPLAPDRFIPAAFLNLALCFGAWAQGEGPSDNPRLLPANQPPGAWTLQWQGKPGRTYFLQNSHDLHTWTYLDTIHHGDGTKMEGVLSNAGKYFLRLRHTDIPCTDPETADFDNDGLGNAAELFWLCDPFLPDSDGDGFKDGWEVMAGWNPNQNNAANADADDDGDGWDNTTEHERGTNPNQADSDTDGLPDPEDADPTDTTIDWPRAPEASRVWVPLTGYNPASHGAPVALSNTGIALFEKAIWKNGAWKMLEWEKEGPTLSYPDESLVVTTTLRAIRALDLADDGRVLGSAELLFEDPYGTGDGEPGLFEHAVQWSEQDGAMVMEFTGLEMGPVMEAMDYGMLPRPAGLSPDGVLFTEGIEIEEPPVSGSSMAWTNGFQWRRHEPGQWKGFPNQTFSIQQSEFVPSEILGGVWLQARNTVIGGKMGIRRSGNTPNPLLGPNGSTDLPAGQGSVCGALSDGRVAFATHENGAWGLKLPPLDSSSAWRPVPKLAGAVAFNARGEAISHDGRFWQNGKWLTPVSEENTPPSGTMHLHDLNDHGVMLATAGDDTSGSGTGPQHAAEAGFLVSVELVTPRKDATGAEIEGEMTEVQDLKISKMEQSLTVEKHAGQVLNIQLDIQKDSDRIYARIPGGAGIGGDRQIQIALESKENTKPQYNDNLTWVSLEAKDKDLVSPPLLLVADHGDDDFEGAVLVGKDDEEQDRTHIVQLGGSVLVGKLKIADVEREIALAKSVRVRKKVVVDFVIINDGNVNLEETSQTIERDLQAANERFAQVGIQIVKGSQTVKPTPVSISDGKLHIESSHKALSENIRTIVRECGTADNIGDIHIFYIPYTLVAGGIFGEAEAVALNGYWDKPEDASYLGNIFMTKIEWSPALAHEIGHVLTNKGHLWVTDFPNSPEYQEKVGLNLMGDYITRTGGIIESKRLLKTQEDLMLNSQYAKPPE